MMPPLREFNAEETEIQGDQDKQEEAAAANWANEWEPEDDDLVEHAKHATSSDSASNP